MSVVHLRIPQGRRIHCASEASADDLDSTGDISFDEKLYRAIYRRKGGKRQWGSRRAHRGPRTKCIYDRGLIEDPRQRAAPQDRRRSFLVLGPARAPFVLDPHLVRDHRCTWSSALGPLPASRLSSTLAPMMLSDRRHRPLTAADPSTAPIGVGKCTATSL